MDGRSTKCTKVNIATHHEKVVFVLMVLLPLRGRCNHGWSIHDCVSPRPQHVRKGDCSNARTNTQELCEWADWIKVILLSFSLACERNMQVNCINQYGTLQYLRGTKDSPCNVRRIVACLNAEKSKRDCLVGDRGTVYYIEAFLRNIDPSKCMDDFDFYEVHQLFQTPSKYHQIHFL